ncbi:MAG: two-component regulator propeller domain-containing protein, partial [Bacteroidota bacterium]
MKATRPISLFLLCTLLSGVMASAQLSPRLQQLRTIMFDHISSEQGLPSDAVNAILEDSRGFMWFGTEGGLCRYDGYNVVAYLPNEADSSSIAGHVISSILEDSNGRILWVATDKGLNAYDFATGKFTHFIPDTADASSLGGLPIFSIYQDRSGSLWIATRRGLNQMVMDSSGGRKFIRYLRNTSDTTSLSSNYVLDVSEGDDGAIWVGTDRGLHRFGLLSKKFKRFLYWENSGYTVAKIQKDDNGVLWLATLRGLVRFDTRTLSFRLINSDPSAPNNLSGKRLAFIRKDKQGKLWLVESMGGLYVLDVETGQVIRISHDPIDPRSLCSDIVRCVYVDRRGSLWIGTNDKGISKIESGRNRYLRLISKPGDPNSLSADAVFPLLEDRHGALWIGTIRGLDRYDRRTGTFTHYVHNPDNSSTLSHSIIWTLIMDSAGAIWAGTAAGLNKIDPSTDHITRYYNEPKPRHLAGYNLVMAVHQDRAGRIWVGTNVGPHLVNTKEKRFERPLYIDGTQAILGDRDGKTLWAGTMSNGLLKIDVNTREVKRFSHDPHDSTSISNNWILAFCEDPDRPDEILWVTTWGGGLNKFDKTTETFTHFDQRYGLADNQIVSIAFDGQGFIWLGTMRGLSRFDPRTKTFRNYDARDGITSGEGNSGGLLRTSSGEIVVGTMKGVTIFHPASLRDNPHIPPIVLTDFRITNKSVVPGTSNSPVTKAITETKEIVLSYLDRMISFEFAALDYVMPAKNQYAYKLEGFDKDWIQSGNVRTATYTNLDPGKYIFRVKGSNNDGIWNEEGTSLSIIITPTWWKT